MKKTLKVLATTSASAVLLSITTACGSEEQQNTHQEENEKMSNTSQTQEAESVLKLSIKDSQGSLDSLRCFGGGKCVVQER